jgi:hypothetical protein
MISPATDFWQCNTGLNPLRFVSVEELLVYRSKRKQKAGRRDLNLFPWCNSPWSAMALLSQLCNHTHHTRQDSFGQVITPAQGPLPDNTQHSQETNIHASGRIWTRNPRKWATTDLHLRPCGHWDRLNLLAFCEHTAGLRKECGKIADGVEQEINLLNKHILVNYLSCVAMKYSKLLPVKITERWQTDPTQLKAVIIKWILLKHNHTFWHTINPLLG